jgi:hypothetical protein
LLPLKIAKGKHQLLIERWFHGFPAKSGLQSKQVPMVFTKCGEASLKIAPASPLAAGEYAIAIQTMSTSLAWGVMLRNAACVVARVDNRNCRWLPSLRS